jgi:PhnB protein
MFQLYLKGCDEAIELYKEAFGVAVEAIHRDPESNAIMHAEIKAFGQYITFMEKDSESVAGNTMQFCFQFGDGYEETVKRAYEVLKDGARIELPIGSCEWSPCIFSLIDKFGVNWLLFV